MSTYDVYDTAKIYLEIFIDTIKIFLTQKWKINRNRSCNDFVLEKFSFQTRDRYSGWYEFTFFLEVLKIRKIFIKWVL